MTTGRFLRAVHFGRIPSIRLAPAATELPWVPAFAGTTTKLGMPAHILAKPYGGALFTAAARGDTHGGNGFRPARDEAEGGSRMSLRWAC